MPRSPFELFRQASNSCDHFYRRAGAPIQILSSVHSGRIPSTAFSVIGIGRFVSNLLRQIEGRNCLIGLCSPTLADSIGVCQRFYQRFSAFQNMERSNSLSPPAEPGVYQCNDHWRRPSSKRPGKANIVSCQLKHGAIIWRLLPVAVYDAPRRNAWAKSIVIGLVFPSMSLWPRMEWSFVRFD
jgi:hypothetical protein